MKLCEKMSTRDFKNLKCSSVGSVQEVANPCLNWWKVEDPEACGTCCFFLPSYF